MKKITAGKNIVKIFAIILVFVLCIFSIIDSKTLLLTVFGIAIILCLWLFTVLKKADLEEQKIAMEELLLFTLSFVIYAVYAASSVMKVGVISSLLFFILLAVCLLLLDIFKGLSVFFSTKRAEIYFKVYNNQSQSKILFLGDSIIMNQGVRDPRSSMQSLVMKEFPDVGITSVGLNGLTTAGLLKLFENEKGDHYKVAVISSGGNDISIFRSLKKIKADLAQLIDEISKISDHIVFVFSYDIGRAPFFSKTLITTAFSKYFNVKSERLIEILLELKKNHDFLLVNLNDPSLGAEYMKKFYDADGNHPNEEGYKKLYEQISEQLKKRGVKL